jgi:peptide/nickel transport system permease protein
MRVVPGDVAVLIVAGEQGYADLEAVERVRHEYGLDRPLLTQYASWVWRLLHLDLDKSYWHRKPVKEFLAKRLQITLQLAIMSTLFAVVMSFPAGVVSAVYQDTWIDYLIRVFSLAALSIPNFWLGIMIILVQVQFLAWSPPVTWTSFLDNPVENLLHTVWPALVVGFSLAGVMTRLMRSSVLEVLRQDYIRTARGKGLSEYVVILRHCVRNALLPYTTFVGLSFALLMGGLLVTERVFNVPGVGAFLVDGLLNRDYPLVQSIIVFFTVVLVLMNLAVDVLYGYLDPRVRYE